MQLIPFERIESRIYVLRGQKVMVDRDLAFLYGVKTRSLNQAVRRNIARFPANFMFQMTKEEYEIWRSQIVISKSDQKGLRWLPSVFTEHGIAMLSSVLRSDQAIAMNIQIIQAFIRMRDMLLTHEELRLRLDLLEQRYDKQFQIVFEAMRRAFLEEDEQNSRIGFHE